MSTIAFGGAIGTVNLGYVQSERSNKDSNLLIITIPTQGVVFGFDILGPQLTIYVDGIVVDSAANIQTFVKNMTNAINGSQNTNGYTYTPDALPAPLHGCLVNRFEATINVGDFKTGATSGCICRYSLELVEIQDTVNNNNSY